MAENSAIEWCDDTFNPWMGCSKVSAECQHCYAERDMDQRWRKVAWGPSGTRVKTSDSNWRKPLKWNRDTALAGERRRVFCASLADVFEDWDGPIRGSGRDDEELAIDDRRSRLLTMDDMRRELFALIDATPHLDWLLLTKRPENIWRMIESVAPANRYMSFRRQQQRRNNVWLGTSAGTQETADKAIPKLLKCRDLSPVLFVSAEPLLGPVDLSVFAPLDWVIAGGESGPNARPMHPDWARSLRDQCADAGVPFFMKQMGGRRKPFADIPEDLMIRSFPEVTYATR